MTTVLPCYSLCPLVEQQSFLGLAADADPDTLLVTANSNIIGRYRLSEPKEIGSWNSKGSISCGAVYDVAERRYAAIFNGNEVRLWAPAEKRVDKAKKYRFAERLHGLATAPDDGRALLIFETGHVRYLRDALEARKSAVGASRLPADDWRICAVEATRCARRPTAVLVARCADQHRVLGVPVDGEPLFDVAVERAQRTLRGHCVLVDEKSRCYLVTLWSDGRLYRDQLYPPATDPAAARQLVATLAEPSADRPVVMAAVSPHDVALCGAHEDGLLLLLFSLRYKSAQCRRVYESGGGDAQPPRRLWRVGSRLFVIMGQNLVAVPFALQNRKLSTLIGSTEPEAADGRLRPESRVCGAELPALLERNAEEEVRRLLRCGRDVPDAALLETVGWALRDVEARGDVLDLVLGEYCVGAGDVAAVRAACSVEQSLYVLERVVRRLRGAEDGAKPLRWAALFVDAFYQQYVMSDDEAVLRRLSEYCAILAAEEEHVNEWAQLSSALSCVQRGKVILTT